MFNLRRYSVIAYAALELISGCSPKPELTPVQGNVKGAIVEKYLGKNETVLIIEPHEGTQIGEKGKRLTVVVPDKVGGVYRPMITNDCLELRFKVVPTSCDLEGEVVGRDDQGRLYLRQVSIRKYGLDERSDDIVEQIIKYGKEAMKKGGELVEKGGEFARQVEQKARELLEKK